MTAYQNLAEELRLKSDEASQRSAVSRIYYSIFHSAKKFLIEVENYDYSENKESHAQIWNEFIKKGKTYKSIGENGKRLRDKRNDADYRDEILKLNDVVETAFRLAHNISTYLQQIQHQDEN